MSLPVVSIVIPAFNEARFIRQLVEQVCAVDTEACGFAREVIVVDDGSSDGTAAIAQSVPGVRVYRKPNGGKGSAVRHGIGQASGTYVLIQDADLEYDPRDYIPMLEALSASTPVIYGSRYLRRGRYPNQSIPAYLGGRSLSLVAFLLTGQWLTDTVTALKLFPTELLRELRLETSGFELDHEITAKVRARGIPIVEVPVRYYPRSRADGKKIGARDWFIAVRTFLRWSRRKT